MIILGWNNHFLLTTPADSSDKERQAFSLCQYLITTVTYILRLPPPPPPPPTQYIQFRKQNVWHLIY